jgi:hypothetical protein
MAGQHYCSAEMPSDNGSDSDSAEDSESGSDISEPIDVSSPVPDGEADEEFPYNLGASAILKYKDEIGNGEDWVNNYRQLVPFLRSQLVDKIVARIQYVQKLKKNQFFVDVEDTQNVHISNEDIITSEAALTLAVQDKRFYYEHLIPFEPTEEISQLLHEDEEG